MFRWSIYQLRQRKMKMPIWKRKKKATPGQDKTQQKINAVQKELTKLYKLRDCGILPDDGKKSIKNLQSELHKLELALNRKKKDAERKS